MEYNEIKHTASSTFVEKDIEELLGDEESEDDSVAFDTIGENDALPICGASSTFSGDGYTT